MLGELVPRAGGPPIRLLKPKLLVGRQAACDIPLRFSTVSSRHCELELRDGYWYVRDLRSTNGTRVNGTLCEFQRLLPNDVLTIATYGYTVVYTAPPGRILPEGESAPAGAQDRLVALKGGGPAARPANTGTDPALGRLVPCGGGEPIPLQKDTLIIGRQTGCDIVLPLGAVSSRHCQLECINGCWFVRDLGSRNGIRVDGVRCDAQRLPPGSVLSIAHLRYRIDYTPRSGKPARPKPTIFEQGLLEKAGLTGWEPEPPSGLRAKPDDPNEPRQRHTLDEE